MAGPTANNGWLQGVKVAYLHTEWEWAAPWKVPRESEQRWFADNNRQNSRSAARILSRRRSAPECGLTEQEVENVEGL